MGSKGASVEMKRRANVNVTLEEPDWFAGKAFPCPVCGSDLQLRVARTQKPYCHCDPCGLQLFFRGKNGIQRLKKLLDSGVLISGRSRATVLYNQLQQLKEQKNQLENRQGLIFRDKDLDEAIHAMEPEIEAVRLELQTLAEANRRKNQ
jgi:predicted RNA-binding Zn-ribbon protein involved in translation (DUF1610 family)